MTWSSSNRRSQLPPDWEREIRPRILKRDRLCRWKEHGDFPCRNRAIEVDHIRRGNDHSDSNLRGLCGYHHQLKSSMEGAEALAKKRERIAQKFVRTETHAGSW